MEISNMCFWCRGIMTDRIDGRLACIDCPSRMESCPFCRKGGIPIKDSMPNVWKCLVCESAWRDGAIIRWPVYPKGFLIVDCGETA